MINFIPSIAKVKKSNRFLAITKALSDNSIPYEVQAIPRQNALGNIIVSFNKDRSKKKLAVTAHYDNAVGTPGANDNAAACSILLNLILFVKEKGTDKNLEFVFFDFEESGFLGSRYYREQNLNLLLGVYNLDMCGMGSNILLSVHNGGETMLPKPLSADVHILKMLPPGDANTFIYSGIPTVYIINSTDHDLTWFREYSDLEFQPHGIPDFGKTMHTPFDTPETCNLRQVEKIYEFLCDSISL